MNIPGKLMLNQGLAALRRYAPTLLLQLARKPIEERLISGALSGFSKLVAQLDRAQEKLVEADNREQERRESLFAQQEVLKKEIGASWGRSASLIEGSIRAHRIRARAQEFLS